MSPHPHMSGVNKLDHDFDTTHRTSLTYGTKTPHIHFVTTNGKPLFRVSKTRLIHNGITANMIGIT